MNELPFNRRGLNATAYQAESGRRVVGSGNNSTATSPSGGTIYDLTPDVFVARLTEEREGAAYGWERVFVSANDTGVIDVQLAAEGSANYGSPTNLPAIEPNGVETLLPGTIVFLWPCEPGGVWQYMIWGTGSASDAAVCVDTVHVTYDGDDNIVLERVTLTTGVWPPEIWLDPDSSEPLIYEDWYESENRDPRIIDDLGTVTHIIPLYQDRDGNYFIVFWKTCTFADLELLTDVSVSGVQNVDCTFTFTTTKTYTTERWFLDVNTPGDASSGLRLRVDTPAALPDVCYTDFDSDYDSDYA